MIALNKVLEWSGERLIWTSPFGRAVVVVIQAACRGVPIDWHPPKRPAGEVSVANKFHLRSERCDFSLIVFQFAVVSRSFWIFSLSLKQAALLKSKRLVTHSVALRTPIAIPVLIITSRLRHRLTAILHLYNYTSSNLNRPLSASESSMISSNRNSYASNTSSPVNTINAIVHRQPLVLDMEEEKKTFASGLDVLEPRPIVYWGGLEERMESF
ncbi:hypothetical protein LCER1_G002198 [Lachnellula cervina]|uniref:Uncharacterized protein n=1 Tax=Lachnellula cervina TaxID=1316786 RepID=A0A7D8YZL8_9HELO|nr:hypothetical protein LCER1_G002198 [Lachnellula cervina]